MAPQVSADSRQSITESGVIFGVPTGLANGQFSRIKCSGHEGHQTEDAKETRSGAFKGSIGDLKTPKQANFIECMQMQTPHP
jgi:hypothetical protein